MKGCTCRKTGTWVGALGRRLFSEKKGRNRPEDETRGQGQTTRQEGQTTAPRPADTRPAHTSERQHPERQPAGQPGTFTPCFKGSTSKAIVAWAAHRQYFCSPGTSLLPDTSRTWQNSALGGGKLSVTSAVPLLSNSCHPHDETRRIDRKRVLEEKRQRSFTRATGKTKQSPAV